MGTRPIGLSHERLWAAIDAIAVHNGLSPSALARRAGLSSTAFNRSKRVTADGRPRWPSTESIAKILATADADLADLVRLMGEGGEAAAGDPLPLPGSGVAYPPGFAEGGAVLRRGGLRFPGRGEASLFAHVVADDATAPLYRRGDVLLASTAAALRRGDRVLIHGRDGAVTIRTFVVRNNRSCIFSAPVGRSRRLRLAHADVLWIARILWASQ